jgi:hypothetical protein
MVEWAVVVVVAASAAQRQPSHKPGPANWDRTQVYLASVLGVRYRQCRSISALINAGLVPFKPG